MEYVFTAPLPLGGADMLFMCQDDLRLFKSDIDAAFRRIPISADHRQFAYVAVMTADGVRIFVHNVMPFGSRASVDHWERVGKPHTHATEADKLGSPGTG